MKTLSQPANVVRERRRNIKVHGPHCERFAFLRFGDLRIDLSIHFLYTLSETTERISSELFHADSKYSSTQVNNVQNFQILNNKIVHISFEFFFKYKSQICQHLHAFSKEQKWFEAINRYIL